MSSSYRPFVRIHYEVPRQRPGWELSEETMPESVPHDHALELLKKILVEAAGRLGASFVARDLAIRWEQTRPAVGVDPDISLFVPPPPGANDLTSVRTWIDGHEAPKLAIEVVSTTNPHKDYVIAPDKYAASGTGELWIFDPLLTGPSVYGGPHRIQIWSHNDEGDFTRIYAGDGPARSPFLGAWIVATNEGRKLRITDDDLATKFWLTREEAALAAKEAAVSAKEAAISAKEAAISAKDAALALADSERTAKEAALARIAELEAALKNR